MSLGQQRKSLTLRNFPVNDTDAFLILVLCEYNIGMIWDYLGSVLQCKQKTYSFWDHLGSASQMPSQPYLGQCEPVFSLDMYLVNLRHHNGFTRGINWLQNQT